MFPAVLSVIFSISVSQLSWNNYLIPKALELMWAVFYCRKTVTSCQQTAAWTAPLRHPVGGVWHLWHDVVFDVFPCSMGIFFGADFLYCLICCTLASLTFQLGWTPHKGVIWCLVCFQCWCHCLCVVCEDMRWCHIRLWCGWPWPAVDFSP